MRAWRSAQMHPIVTNSPVTNHVASFKSQPQHVAARLLERFTTTLDSFAKLIISLISQ
eukprot:IDg13490t1